MGLFIGLQLSEQDLQNIENFQQGINVPNPVKKEDIHCTLFSTIDNLDYKSTLQLPLEITDMTLGKIKTQSGVDCLVLYFNNEVLRQYHDSIAEKYHVRPFYPEFIAHITLSYDCGEINIKSIDVNQYISRITFVKEYAEQLKFEVNYRKTVRNS